MKRVKETGKSKVLGVNRSKQQSTTPPVIPFLSPLSVGQGKKKGKEKTHGPR